MSVNYSLKFLVLATAMSGLSLAEETPSSEKSNVDDSDAILLRYKFNAGEKLRYQTSQNVTQQVVSPAGQKLDVSSVEQKRLFRIEAVDEAGVADASMQFEHVRMETQTDDNDRIIYDSSMAPSAVPPKYRSVANGLKKAAPKFHLSPMGTPLSKDGVEEVSAVANACFMMPLPKEEIRIGDFWSSKIPVDVRLAPGVMRKINLQRSYKLKAVNDGIAEIVFYTSLENQIKTPQVKALLLQATPNGTIEFDIQKGRVVRRELRFDNFVLGALGPNTMLTAKGKTVEQLVVDEPVAQLEKD